MARFIRYHHYNCLCFMEGARIFKKNFLKISHLPTLCLSLGYFIYWFELYYLDTIRGRTTNLAALLFVSVSIFVFVIKKNNFCSIFKWAKGEFYKQPIFNRCCIVIASGLIMIIASLAFYASLLPPHLTQEFDALNYHLTLPRQHLILNSFQHIKWSSADLFLLPIDFALAPYCLTSELPSKLIYFFFLLGLVLVSAKLVERLSGAKFLSMCLVVSGIFGSHFIGIQMGTAMLDIVLCYLFLAALDSFLDGRILLSALEFSFLFWSKPFVPFQAIFIFLSLLLVWAILKKLFFKEAGLGFGDIITKDAARICICNFKKILPPFVIFSAIIAGPFLIKSTYYSGTPLFPFAPGSVDIGNNIDRNSGSWNSTLRSSKTLLTARDSYGHGRSLAAFIKHFWIIAVPENGVNNKYDYPVGLMYLLFLGPFFYLLFLSFKKRKFAILPFISIVYWLSWWFGSQQTRFLYIPIVIMMITVSSEISKPSKVLMSAVIISLLLNAISVFRANRRDLGVDVSYVLRAKDREIIKLNAAYLREKRQDSVYLDYYDVAYACFPVTVTKESLPWVIDID